jgi:hypothetical protein
MYGAKYSQAHQGLAEPLDHRLGANSEAFVVNDLVTYASGFLEVVDGTGDRPVGISKKTVTMSASNQTVAKVQVPFIPLTPADLFEMDFDSVGTEASVGMFFQLSGASGAQVVTVGSASATVGQLLCHKVDPRGEGSMLRGLFSVALPLQAFEPET